MRSIPLAAPRGNASDARGAVLAEVLGFDRKPVVVIATWHSDNVKTGDMIQVWILPRDTNPYTDVQNGADVTVCGDCPFRSGNGCYVQVRKAPAQVWRAYQSGAYPRWNGSLEPFRGRMVRFGAYGEPALIPQWLLRDIARVAEGTTGYTHAWRNLSPVYRRWLMASVESLAEMAIARAAGWRTFRVRCENSPLAEHEILCPASEEGGKRRTCERCGACDGAGLSVGSAGRASVAIIAHGRSHCRAAEVVERSTRFALEVIR